MSPTKADVKLCSEIMNEIKQRDKYGLRGKQTWSQNGRTEPTGHHLKLFKQSWKEKLGQMK